MKNMESLVLCVCGLKADQTNLWSYTLEKWLPEIGAYLTENEHRELCWVMEILNTLAGVWVSQVYAFVKTNQSTECISMDENYSLILTCPLKRTSKCFPNLHESFSIHPGKPTLHLDLTGVVSNICRHFGT